MVDDLSTDNTDEVMNEWTSKDKRFQYYKRNREPKGAPTCRNIGLDKAQGEYVIFLDSDDLLADFCLKKRIECLSENPDMDLLISYQQRIENGVPKALINIPSKIHPLIRFYTLMEPMDIPWLVGGFTVKREFLLKNYIKWDELTKLHQDIQFNISMLLSNPNCSWSDLPPDCFWIYNSHNINIGSDINNLFLKRLNILNVFWKGVRTYKGDPNFTRKLLKQYLSLLNAYFLAVVKTIKSEQYEELNAFFKKNPGLPGYVLGLYHIMYRIKLLNRRKYIHRFVYYRIEKFLKWRFRPVISEGTFLKIFNN